MYSDHYINFELHVKKVAQSCFLQLRNIGKIQTVLSCLDLEKILHDCVSSCLDYRSSLLLLRVSAPVGPERVYRSLTNVRYRYRYRSHITPLLANLHWLPIDYRIGFTLF